MATNLQNIGPAIEVAAERLPEGWNLSVDVERGSAVVLIWDQEGEPVDHDEYEDQDGDIAQEIRNAVAHAIAREQS